MEPNLPLSPVNRRAVLSALALLPAVSRRCCPRWRKPPHRTILLPSWNDGAAKQAIINFISVTTDTSSPDFVPLEERIATFDQDGTLWVEHPIYTQVVFALDVFERYRDKPDWKTSTVQIGVVGRRRGDGEVLD